MPRPVPKILRIGHFLSSNTKLWIGFQPFVYHRCVTKYPINTTIFQIDKGILITVIRDSFSLPGADPEYISGA